MLKNSSPILRTGMLAVLLPVLLLLPTFHTHSDHQHTHGHAARHGHPAVIHADFFAISVHDAHDERGGHDAHNQDHDVPDENSSQASFHISLFTLLPRSLVLLTPASEREPFSFLTGLPAVTALSLIQSWLHWANHPPPVQSVSFPAISPRSPPHLV